MGTQRPRKERRGPWWLLANSRGVAIAFLVIWDVEAIYLGSTLIDDFEVIRLLFAVGFALFAAAYVPTIAYFTRHRLASVAPSTGPSPSSTVDS